MASTVPPAAAVDPPSAKAANHLQERLDAPIARREVPRGAVGVPSDGENRVAVARATSLEHPLTADAPRLFPRRFPRGTRFSCSGVTVGRFAAGAD